MKIENITKEAQYTNPENIPANSFFYDEIGSCLYYVSGDYDERMLFIFDDDGVQLENSIADCSVQEIIDNTISNTSRLRLIDSDDVKLTYKFKE